MGFYICTGSIKNPVAKTFSKAVLVCVCLSLLFMVVGMAMHINTKLKKTFPNVKYRTML